MNIYRKHKGEKVTHQKTHGILGRSQQSRFGDSFRHLSWFKVRMWWPGDNKIWHLVNNSCRDPGSLFWIGPFKTGPGFFFQRSKLVSAGDSLGRFSIPHQPSWKYQVFSQASSLEQKSGDGDLQAWNPRVFGEPSQKCCLSPRSNLSWGSGCVNLALLCFFQLPGCIFLTKGIGNRRSSTQMTSAEAVLSPFLSGEPFLGVQSRINRFSFFPWKYGGGRGGLGTGRNITSFK